MYVSLIASTWAFLHVKYLQNRRYVPVGSCTCKFNVVTCQQS